MLGFVWLMLLAYAGLVFPASSQDHNNNNKNIFILAGQSNMSGRGGINNLTWNGVVPPQCQPNPAILRLSSELKWVQASEPLHKDIDVNATCGVGPGMVFANTVLDSNGGVVGLVPCAIGGTKGTKISEWGRGTYLYNQLLRRASAALQNGGGSIQAVLWYQGESDTVNLQDAALYKGRLERFFMDLRADLQSPLLPIIQVALASGQGPYIEKVREAQLGIDLAHVKCVDAKGLQLEPDHLHLTTQAEVQLGKMLADAFLHTLPTPLQKNHSYRGVGASSQWKSPQQRKSFFDSEDFFLEPKQSVSMYGEIEKRLKMRGIDEPSKDLETLRQSSRDGRSPSKSSPRSSSSSDHRLPSDYQQNTSSIASGNPAQTSFSLSTTPLPSDSPSPASSGSSASPPPIAIAVAAVEEKDDDCKVATKLEPSCYLIQSVFRP